MAEHTRRVEEIAPHLRWPESFAAIVAAAREVLRGKGYSHEQIEHELHRKTRAEFDE